MLSDNYYTLFSRSCLNAYQLSNNNLVHEAMSKGKMVSTVSNSTVGSNNGLDVYRDMENIKYNNPAYNYLLYVLNLSKGNTISDSFYEAKKGYATKIMEEEHRTFGDGHGNYQFQVLNILSQHYLGILEDSKKQGSVTLEDIYSNLTLDLTVSNGVITPDITNDNVDVSKMPTSIPNQKEDFISFKEDNLKYSVIPSKFSFDNKAYKLNYTGIALDKEYLYLKVKYTSPIHANITIFLQSDTPGLKEHYDNGTKIGENMVIFKLKKEDVKTYNNGLAINLGERNFVFIDKKLMDSFASK